MTTTEVATKLVDLCKQGKNLEAVKTLYAKDIISLEPMAFPPMPAESRGLDAIAGKNQWWLDNHIVHSGTAAGPFIARDQFAVHFQYDVTFKPTGKRQQMSEVALYWVKEGKIVREEFFYAAADGPEA